jgi:hypothetical protein
MPSISISSELSRLLVGFSHATGIPIEEVIANGLLQVNNPIPQCVENILESGYDSSPEEQNRILQVLEIARTLEDKHDWDEFLIAVKGLPSFDPKDYPPLIPNNVVAMFS